MNKYILGIDGMGCGHCEIHVQDIVRKNFDVIKVKASHTKNNVRIITNLELTENDFHVCFDPTGYKVTSFSKSQAVKTLFGWK